MVAIAGTLAAWHVIASAWGFDPFWSFLLTLPFVPIFVVAILAIWIPLVPLSWRIRLVETVFIAVIVSVPYTHWPLHLMFALHKPWLEPIADQVKTTGTSKGPTRVGLWWFECIILRQNGNVGFQLSGDAGGGMFLVRDEPGSTVLWYNSATLADLGDRWHVVHED